MVCHDVDHDNVVCDQNDVEVDAAYDDVLVEVAYDEDNRNYNLSYGCLQKQKSCHCNKKSLLQPVR